MKARVVVIGGGVMGVSVAMHLVSRLDPLGEPVVLLERRTLGAGSSGRSGAILRQHYSFAELAGMARDSLKVYAAFARNTGRSIGFQRTGVLTLAGPGRPEDIQLVRRNVAMMADIGIDTWCVDAGEIRRLVPGIAVGEGTLGAWEPDGGVVDPLDTVEALGELAKSHGATIRLGCAVRALRISNGAVAGVETDEGLLRTACVVAAAGPWTRALLAAHGIELPLRVVRPEQHFLEMPAAVASAQAAASQAAAEQGMTPVEEELGERFGGLAEPPPPAHPVLLDIENGFYSRCETGLTRTRIGSMDIAHLEEVEDPDRVDEAVGERFKRWAREALARRMPVYRDRPAVASQVGLYTMTPDSQALIGELPEAAGLFVVAGFSGHGFKLAPSVGEGLAQMVCGEPVSAFDPAFFSPVRFAEARARSAGRGFGL